jgi:hypothetical protein
MSVESDTCTATTNHAWLKKVFKCQLPEGHDGLHVNTESGLRVEWDYDDG